MNISIAGCPPYADHYALACNMLAVAAANAATLRGLSFERFDMSNEEWSLTQGNYKYNSGHLENKTCTDGTTYYSIWQCYTENSETYDLYVFRYQYVQDQQTGVWHWQYQGYTLVYADETDSYQFHGAMRNRWYMFNMQPPYNIRLDNGTVVQLPENYNAIPVEYRPDYGWIFTADIHHANDQMYLYTTGYGEITQSNHVQYGGQQITLGNTPVGLFDDGSFLSYNPEEPSFTPLLIRVSGGYATDIGYSPLYYQLDTNWFMVGDTALAYTTGGADLNNMSRINAFALQHVFNGVYINSDAQSEAPWLLNDLTEWLNSQSVLNTNGDGYYGLLVGDVPFSYMDLRLNNAAWQFHQPLIQCSPANYNGGAMRGYWLGTAIDGTHTPYKHVVISAYVNGIEGIHQPFNKKFEAWSFNENGGQEQKIGFYSPVSFMRFQLDAFQNDVIQDLALPSFVDAYSVKGTPITKAYEAQLSLLLAMLWNMGIDMPQNRSWWTDADLSARLLKDPLEAIYNGLGDWGVESWERTVRMFTKVDYKNKFIREITL